MREFERAILEERPASRMEGVKWRLAKGSGTDLVSFG